MPITPEGNSSTGERRCRPDLPLSLVLGAGGVRGLAHVAILQTLLDAGFHIDEITGTSIGAIVAGFYAAIGLDLDSIREAGLSLKSSHLFAWAVLRRTPANFRRRYLGLAGVIPKHMDDLSAGSFDRLHHGVRRVGIVAYDRITNRQVVFHNEQPILRLEDAVRGAAAVPGLFPPWKCSAVDRSYRLVDGGTYNGLPAEVLFEPPFEPAQVLAVDISKDISGRQRNLARVQTLRSQFPNVPIDCLCVDTLHGSSVLYRSSYAARLLELGREAAVTYLSRPVTAERPAG